MTNKGQILVISGPSGAGKSTICNVILNNFENVYFSISTTTRKPRIDDVEGKTYYFVDEKQFLEDVERGLFLEYAKVHNNYYGTHLSQVKAALESGKLVIFDIDVQGHRNLKNIFKDNFKSVFITTKDRETLKNRLISRESDSLAVIDERLNFAFDELKCASEFDYLIINEDIEKTKKAILDIVNASKFEVDCEKLPQLLKAWL